MKREESTTRMGVVSKPSAQERRDLIRAHTRGKWTGTTPTSRQGFASAGKKKGQGPGAKPLDEIASRFPHSLFEKNRGESAGRGGH